MKNFLATLLMLLAMAGTPAAGQKLSQFPKISVPSIYTDGYSRQKYYAEHYWDKYDFSAFDKTYSKEVTEQAFADYSYVLQTVPYADSAVAVERMMTLAACTRKSYDRFLELSERYFYDPNSPFRNDEFFIPAVRHALEGKVLDNESKIRYRSLWKIINRNRPGTVAADFVYTLQGGKQGRMHDIKSEILIIFFYNPGCHNCNEVKQQLEESGAVNALRSTGRLKLLAVYPDKDLADWRKRLPENPSWWISSYDKGSSIQKNATYDLKAIPTLYLLDASKTVVLKDPVPENLIGLLERAAAQR